LHEENPERIDECMKLYTPEAVWEAPARNVTYVGREKIKEMYLRIFRSLEPIPGVPLFEPIERFASPERVFDDMWIRFRLKEDGFDSQRRSSDVSPIRVRRGRLLAQRA
jgi:hypothetical protein